MQFLPLIGPAISAVSGIKKLLGFKKGGRVPGKRGKAQLAIVHGGEYVVPAHQAKQIEAALRTHHRKRHRKKKA